MEYRHELGSIQGREYQIQVSATPDLNEPTDFSASIVYYDSAPGEHEEVARIDNSHGKGPPHTSIIS